MLASLAAWSFLASAAFASPVVTDGDLTCTAFHAAGGLGSDQYKINFYNTNPSGEPGLGPANNALTLPSNATIASSSGTTTLVLDTTSTGLNFEVTACNGTNMIASTQSSCGDGGCYHTYTTYVQIKPTSARTTCLTNTGYSTMPNATTLTFTECPSSTEPSQFWIATQQVLYTMGYGSVQSWGTVQLNPQETDVIGNGYRALNLDSADNRTVQVVTASYTQVGLGANLIQVPA